MLLPRARAIGGGGNAGRGEITALELEGSLAQGPGLSLAEAEEEAWREAYAEKARREGK